MKLCRQEIESPGGILESEAWQLGLYGPGRQKLKSIFDGFPPFVQQIKSPGGHYLPHFDAFDSDQMPPDSWGRDDVWVGSR